MTDKFIATHSDLVEACAELRREKWIALDTEFMRERTYYAKLCLVQIGTPQSILCIDPLAIDDLTPLLELVCDPAVLKVMHAARQDMEVFYDLWRVRQSASGPNGDEGRVPGPVFDTQVAAAYLGYDDQIGYAALVKAITGTELDKAHTRTDWSARPLSPEQVRYAEDDVRYLRDIYQALTKALEAAGRSRWPQQDFDRLGDSRTYESDPDVAWQRVRNAQQLDSKARRALMQLAAWRELAARSSNLPRSWVLNDSALLELARKRPVTSAGLEAAISMTPRAVHRWGTEILEAIAAAESSDSLDARLPRQTLDSEQMELYRRLTAEIDRVARELGISSALLGPRRDIQRLVCGDRDLPLLGGWRREMVGERLLTMLEPDGTLQSDIPGKSGAEIGSS